MISHIKTNVKNVEYEVIQIVLEGERLKKVFYLVNLKGVLVLKHQKVFGCLVTIIMSIMVDLILEIQFTGAHPCVLNAFRKVEGKHLS